MTKFVAVVAVLSCVSAASAQTQVKPHFLVIMDNSGSMNAVTGGGLNSCGFEQTRMSDAKCALTRTINAFGDVTFGLVRFRNDCTGTSCTPICITERCNCPCTRVVCTDCNEITGENCPADGNQATQGQVLVPIEEDNQNSILRWVDYTCNGCPRTVSDPELYANSPTPLAGSLRGARRYLEGGDPDFSSPMAIDDFLGCRPYYVILLTDGSETCATYTDTYDAASELRTTSFGGDSYDVRTYVIGFGLSGNSLIRANNIANAGGTGTAFLASDEESLALAFSQIISGSILTELCGGGDEDCDGNIDEGFAKYCDRDNVFGGGATSSLDYCSDPGDDCDGSDDNCFDGTADEPVGPCGVCNTPPEICDRIDNNCNGQVDEGDVCMGCNPTGAERCDNQDNNCNGQVDEGLTRQCGTDVGVCVSGIETCNFGVWSGCTAVGGGPETCDGLDNDCDGRVDGLTMPCGSDTGTCRRGVRVCTDGAFGDCIGALAEGEEVCDGRDNDCDGNVDETDPMLGDACGSDIGACIPGTTQCSDGRLMCMGAMGPFTETCNDIDDDCDGLVDNEVELDPPTCGTDVGLCIAGRNVCRDGEVVCEGEVGVADEMCNSLDDDCDGSVDEDLSLGVPCGSTEGTCLLGTTQCIDGRELCIGEVPPSIEACDCEDNDCDGSLDEGADSLCPEGSRCTECQCALPCQQSEFGFTCPTGKSPSQIGDECFCVAARCEPAACAQETRVENGETLCGGESGINCVCRNNQCTFPCDGVECSGGLVCDPGDGRCVEDSCRFLGCPDSERCDFEDGECEPDPCAEASCGEAQACRDGACVESCALVGCGRTERCNDGECVSDPCGGVFCPSTEHCHEGECQPDPCVTEGISCPRGFLCESSSGECVLNPCNQLRCPDDQVCRNGQCALASSMDGGVGPGLDGGSGRQEERILATGGGGCACTAPGSAGPPTNPAWLLLLLALLGWRRRRVLVVGGVALVLVVGTGCDVDPFCLTCEGEQDAGEERDASVSDAGGRDASDGSTQPVVDAGCTPGVSDECNRRDDDCDGEIDEDVDTATDPNHCGGCGQLCAPPGAFGRCEEGICNLERCDVGYFNLDSDDDNGCEYRCLPTAVDDSRCDNRDNDCDGERDEDVDLSNNVLNCGQCGRECRFANAEASCEGGDCVLGACEAGFFNADGLDATGCEYACASGGDERCNLVDDDCDGQVDENNPEGGGSCGAATGACQPGTLTCRGGRLVCDGLMSENIETCNGIDDDCDDEIDEGLIDDDIRNCGSCGNVCTYDHGFAQCEDGQCELVTCENGYWDADQDAAQEDSNGCEYECDFQGAEGCNGVDDDCDGRVDEELSAPSNFCNPNGVCGSAPVVCAGTQGWRCELPSTFEESETRCDELDNDCDGLVDEDYFVLGLGTSCTMGSGGCQRNGSIICSDDEMGVECSEPAPGMPQQEICDNIDNDCDGLVDEPSSNPGTNPSFVIEEMVHVDFGGNDFWIYQYEASRQDATSMSSGASNARACSRRDVLPWVQVQYPEAQAACAAAGMRLCTEAEWQAACETESGCGYSYSDSAACDTYDANRCNGNDHDGIPGGSDDDVLLPTRSLLQCSASHPDGQVFDMSGNAKEWTLARSANVNPIRGGSFNNPGGGLRCDFDFTVADDAFQITSVGFRCCSSFDPATE